MIRPVHCAACSLIAELYVAWAQQAMVPPSHPFPEDAHILSAGFWLVVFRRANYSSYDVCASACNDFRSYAWCTRLQCKFPILANESHSRECEKHCYGYAAPSTAVHFTHTRARARLHHQPLANLHD